MITKNVLDQLRQTTRAAFQKVIRDRIQDRLEIALGEPAPEAETVIERSATGLSAATDIETTEEELIAFYIVQAIGSELVEPSRISIRDAKSYCSILFDDNNRKPICRLYFNAKNKKHIGVFDTGKSEARHEISAPKDIFSHKAALQGVISGYL